MPVRVCVQAWMKATPITATVMNQPITPAVRTPETDPTIPNPNSFTFMSQSGSDKCVEPVVFRKDIVVLLIHLCVCIGISHG
jgi:hypothetical protein